jgi:hypothetical protein
LNSSNRCGRAFFSGQFAETLLHRFPILSISWSIFAHKDLMTLQWFPVKTGSAMRIFLDHPVVVVWCVDRPYRGLYPSRWNPDPSRSIACFTASIGETQHLKYFLCRVVLQGGHQRVLLGSPSMIEGSTPSNVACFWHQWHPDFQHSKEPFVLGVVLHGGDAYSGCSSWALLDSIHAARVVMMRSLWSTLATITPSARRY